MTASSATLPGLRGPLRRLAGALALFGLLAGGGCKPKEPPRGPLGQDEARTRAAELERHLKRHPDDRAALRDLAHLRWLHLGDLKSARPLLERLAEGGDVVAMGSLMTIADARLDLVATRRWAEAIVLAAAKMDAGAAGRPLALGLAEAAARRLDALIGEIPGDDAHFIAFFEGVDRSRLPAAVTQPLLSGRASIARRHDEPYLSFYDAEGCVRAWQVGVVEGTLGELELRRRSEGALKVDAEASLASLSCAVRVWNPSPRAGARRLATTLDVPGERLELEISAQSPIRAYLDGALVVRSDTDDRWAPRRARVDLPVTPGPHRLEVHMAMPSEKAWLMVRATDAAGRAIASQAAPVEARAPFRGAVKAPRGAFEGAPAGLDPRIYAPWTLAFALADALADADSDQAEVHARALADAGGTFPEGQIAIAAFEAEDPSRERTASAARERRALERALAADAGLDRARIRLLELGLDRGDFAEVVGELEALPKGSLAHVDGELLRFRAYTARGSEPLAEAALARAAALHPGSCEVLKEQRGLAQRRLEVEREAELVEKSRLCPGTLSVRAGLARRRGDFAEARRILEQALARSPDDVDFLVALADLEIADGRLDAAMAVRSRLLALNPYSPRVRVGLADLVAAKGDAPAARAAVREAIARMPYATALREIGAEVGLEDDLEALRVDGMAALRAYWALEIAPYAGTAEVLVLDRSAARIYPDGGVRQIVHTITELRSREAVDRYGEVDVPEGARLLTLQSIKRDGRVVEPELIPGKDGLSLRGLAIGDAVEMEMIVDQEPNGLLPGSVDLSTFRFQSYDVPFFVSELEVFHPRSMAVKVESRAGAPATQRREAGDDVALKWRVENSPRRGVEPGARSLLDELPSVRVYTEVDVGAWLDALALRIGKAQRSNPELRRLARRLTRGEKGARAKVDALRAWVVEKVEEAGDVSTPATRTLSARKGNRLMLMRALLHEVGIRSEVWIGRDRFGPELLKGGHPMVETYEAPVLMVWLGEGEGPTPVLTHSKSVPMGYLPPNLSGGLALRVRLGDDEPAPGPVTLPKVPEALRDRRSYALELDLAGDGSGSASGSITLQGMEALIWREALRTLDRDRLHEGFERAELAVILQGATFDLEDLQIDHERELDAPLVLRFEASVRGVGVRQGADLVLRAALVPMNLGLGFTGLPERTTGMVIPYAPVQEAEVTVRLAEGTFKAAPGPAAVESEFGAFSRAVTGKGTDTLTIRTRSTLRPGIVEADEYAELVGMVRAIRQAEDEVARAR